MMTTVMQENFGYDPDGNAPHLLAPQDAEALERGDFLRVAGESQCKCGSLHRHHPPVQGALWLVRSCEGLVKL